jgi:hypothetical protein
MNPPEVFTEFCAPDPNAAPLNLTQLVSLLNVLVHSEIRDPYLSVLLQHGTPNTADQDKVWFEKDTAGRPVSIKVFYNGRWRRIYNGMLGEIRGYSGAPGYHDNDPTSDFDSTGLGNVGGNYDGWGLCDGKNGRPDFSDKFLIGAHMNNKDSHTGYKQGWQAFINTAQNASDQKTGGQFEVTLNEDNTFRKPNPGFGIDHFEGDTGRNPDGHLFGKPNMVGGVQDADLTIFEDDGKTPTTDPPIKPIPTIPPFIALGWIIFVGYKTT